eukprot:TRINITY_DN58692_c0_g1_i1.p1 TRINITY_DN58692_c0_g1~~TRINITY_DN58692_c0_g1_i1.p1  ORF type:complete len:1709 (-),score=559.79 TRINITY_DN58692_c0_g1_i1:37-5163(-)
MSSGENGDAAHEEKSARSSSPAGIQRTNSGPQGAAKKEGGTPAAMTEFERTLARRRQTVDCEGEHWAGGGKRTGRQVTAPAEVQTSTLVFESQGQGGAARATDSADASGKHGGHQVVAQEDSPDVSASKWKKPSVMKAKAEAEAREIATTLTDLRTGYDTLKKELQDTAAFQEELDGRLVSSEARLMARADSLEETLQQQQEDQKAKLEETTASLTTTLETKVGDVATTATGLEQRLEQQKAEFLQRLQEVQTELLAKLDAQCASVAALAGQNAAAVSTLARSLEERTEEQARQRQDALRQLREELQSSVQTAERSATDALGLVKDELASSSTDLRRELAALDVKLSQQAETMTAAAAEKAEKQLTSAVAELEQCLRTLIGAESEKSAEGCRSLTAEFNSVRDMHGADLKRLAEFEAQASRQLAAAEDSAKSAGSWQEEMQAELSKRNGQVANRFEELTARLDAFVGSLAEGCERETSLQRALRDLTSSVEERFGGVETRFAEQAAALEKSFGDKVREVRERTEEATKSFSQQVKQAEDSARVEEQQAAQETTRAEVEALQGKLAKEVEGLEAKLLSQMQDMRDAEQARQRQALEDRVAEAEKTARTQLEDESRSREELVGSTKKELETLREMHEGSLAELREFKTQALQQLAKAEEFEKQLVSLDERQQSGAEGVKAAVEQQVSTGLAAIEARVGELSSALDAARQNQAEGAERQASEVQRLQELIGAADAKAADSAARAAAAAEGADGLRERLGSLSESLQKDRTDAATKTAEQQSALRDELLQMVRASEGMAKEQREAAQAKLSQDETKGEIAALRGEMKADLEAVEGKLAKRLDEAEAVQKASCAAVDAKEASLRTLIDQEAEARQASLGTSGIALEELRKEVLGDRTALQEVRSQVQEQDMLAKVLRAATTQCAEKLPPLESSVQDLATTVAGLKSASESNGEAVASMNRSIDESIGALRQEIASSASAAKGAVGEEAVAALSIKCQEDLKIGLSAASERWSGELDALTKLCEQRLQTVQEDARTLIDQAADNLRQEVRSSGAAEASRTVQTAEAVDSLRRSVEQNSEEAKKLVGSLAEEKKARDAAIGELTATMEEDRMLRDVLFGRERNAREDAVTQLQKQLVEQPSKPVAEYSIDQAALSKMELEELRKDVAAQKESLFGLLEDSAKQRDFVARLTEQGATLEKMESRVETSSRESTEAVARIEARLEAAEREFSGTVERIGCLDTSLRDAVAKLDGRLDDVGRETTSAIGKFESRGEGASQDVLQSVTTLQSRFDGFVQETTSAITNLGGRVDAASQEARQAAAKLETRLEEVYRETTATATKVESHAESSRDALDAVSKLQNRLEEVAREASSAVAKSQESGAEGASQDALQAVANLENRLEQSSQQTTSALVKLEGRVNGCSRDSAKGLEDLQTGLDRVEFELSKETSALLAELKNESKSLKTIVAGQQTDFATFKVEVEKKAAEAASGAVQEEAERLSKLSSSATGQTNGLTHDHCDEEAVLGLIRKQLDAERSLRQEEVRQLHSDKLMLEEQFEQLRKELQKALAQGLEREQRHRCKVIEQLKLRIQEGDTGGIGRGRSIVTEDGAVLPTPQQQKPVARGTPARPSSTGRTVREPPAMLSDSELLSGTRQPRPSSTGRTVRDEAPPGSLSPAGVRFAPKKHLGATPPAPPLPAWDGPPRLPQPSAPPPLPTDLVP